MSFQGIFLCEASSFTLEKMIHSVNNRRLQETGMDFMPIANQVHNDMVSSFLSSLR